MSAESSPDPHVDPSSHPLYERVAGSSNPGEPVIPGFEIEALIGRGAMAEVWRARQKGRLARTVAIKLIRADCVDADRLGRFELEARALSAVEDARIVKPFEVGIAVDGRPFIVMEFIDGVPLAPAGIIAQLDLRERIGLIVSLLIAVESLHARGIVHRDLKPSNVLMIRNGDMAPEVRLIDLGLAKFLGADSVGMTQDGAIVGTPEFMSPEQAGTIDCELSERSDVYSIGIMLYGLVEGALPWSVPGPSQSVVRAVAYQRLLQRMRNEPPRPCSRCDAALEAVIKRAIRADPSQRTASAADLRRELEAWLGGSHGAGGVALRHRWRLFAGLVGGSVALAALFTFMQAEDSVGAGAHEPPGLHGTRLAWVEDSHGVMVGRPGTPDVRLLAGSWSNPRGLDVEPESQRVYWTDFSGRIERIRLDGTERQTIGGYRGACGIDAIGGSIVWTMYGDGRCIWTASNEGVGPSHVTADVRSPTGVRQVADGLYLFSDWETNGIYLVRSGQSPERVAFVDGVYGIDYRDRWVYYGDRTTRRILATNIDDRKSVVLVEDESVGRVWQVVVSRRGDRVWWTRHQPQRAICTAAVSLEALEPASVQHEFPLERDPWGLAIVEEP